MMDLTDGYLWFHDKASLWVLSHDLPFGGIFLQVLNHIGSCFQTSVVSAL